MDILKYDPHFGSLSNEEEINLLNRAAQVAIQLQIISLMLAMDDIQRANLRSNMSEYFCMQCFSKDTKCQCWNDE